MATWDTGPLLHFSISWGEETGRTVGLYAAKEGTQVTHGHLFNEGRAVLSEVPPLKDLRPRTQIDEKEKKELEAVKERETFHMWDFLLNVSVLGLRAV